jgi:hypothetical protein
MWGGSALSKARRPAKQLVAREPELLPNLLEVWYVLARVEAAKGWPENREVSRCPRIPDLLAHGRKCDTAATDRRERQQPLQDDQRQRLPVLVQPAHTRLELPRRPHRHRAHRGHPPVPLLTLGQHPQPDRRIPVPRHELQQRVVIHQLCPVSLVPRVESPGFDELEQRDWRPTGPHDLRPFFSQTPGAGVTARASKKDGCSAVAPLRRAVRCRLDSGPRCCRACSGHRRRAG